MEKKRMIAAKPFRYGMRALRAGDMFDVNRRDAGLLVRLGRATVYEAREAAVVPPPPAEVEPLDMDDLTERAKSVGLKVDARWRPETLARKVEEAGAAS